MNPTNETIENALAAMAPRRVDQGLSDRLIESAEFEAANAELLRNLRALRPAALSAAQLTRLNALPEVPAELEALRPAALTEKQGAELLEAAEYGETEGIYRSLTPAALAEEHKATLTEESELAELAGTLSAASPAALRPAFFESMLESVEDAASGPASNIVEFPAPASAAEKDEAPARKPARRWWAAAAAVAACGAILGSLIPGQPGTDPAEIVGTPGEGGVSPGSASLANSGVAPLEEPRLPAFARGTTPRMLPVAYDTPVRKVQDQGIVWEKSQVPHRCLEVDQVESHILLDDQGRERKFERPVRRRRVIIPVESN